MTDVEIPILERPAFFDGQLLTAADLAEVQRFHRELRWLHNRALHDWGVVFGLGVTGERGDRTVRVEPGYALDCRGRDLIQNEAAVLEVPPVAGAKKGGPALYYLTSSYLEDADIEPESRTGACDTDGAVRREEQVRLRWQDPTDTEPASRFRPGLDVVLASAKIENCKLAEAVSTAERRQAASVLRPYVGAGKTPWRCTPWRLWPDEKRPLGYAAAVSTVSAGFRAEPRYQARLAGEREFAGTLGSAFRSFVVDGYLQVVDATPSGFTACVLLARGATLSPETYGIAAEDLKTVVAAALWRTAYEVAGEAADVSEATVDLFVEANGLDEPGAAIAAGTRLTAHGSPWDAPDSEAGVVLEVNVEPSDFAPALVAIADQVEVSAADLVEANDLEGSPSFTIGEALVAGGSTRQLNPPEVLTPEFVEHVRTTLGWHVVWTGVEA